MTRLPATTVNDDSLRGKIGVSAGLHIAFLLFLYFGLPSLMKPLPMPSEPIPIDIVDIAELTNTRLKDQTPEPPKPPEQPPPPEQKVAPPPPTPPVPPTPPEQAKPTPPEPKPAPVEAITPEVKPTEKPPPPKPVVEKPHQDMLASVLKNVEKMKPAETVKTPPDVKNPAQAQPKSLAPSLSDRLTISENDMLVRQVEQHWNVPIGARDIQNIVVQIHIDVNPDRSVQHAEIISNSGMSSNPYYRAVAESALRAVYASSPLELPEGKYEQWKGIDISFSAKDML